MHTLTTLNHAITATADEDGNIQIAPAPVLSQVELDAELINNSTDSTAAASSTWEALVDRAQLCRAEITRGMTSAELEETGDEEILLAVSNRLGVDLNCAEYLIITQGDTPCEEPDKFKSGEKQGMWKTHDGLVKVFSVRYADSEIGQKAVETWEKTRATLLKGMRDGVDPVTEDGVVKGKSAFEQEKKERKANLKAQELEAMSADDQVEAIRESVRSKTAALIELVSSLNEVDYTGSASDSAAWEAIQALQDAFPMAPIVHGSTKSS